MTAQIRAAVAAQATVAPRKICLHRRSLPHESHRVAGRAGFAAPTKIVFHSRKLAGARTLCKRPLELSANAVAASATTAEELKAQLKAELEGSRARLVINELLLQLESVNPTDSPARSPLLTGGWSFAYNGNIAPGPVPSPTRPIALLMYAGGFSPGTFGLTVRPAWDAVHHAAVCSRLKRVDALQVASMLPANILKTSDFKLSIAGIEPYTSVASITVETLGT